MSLSTSKDIVSTFILKFSDQNNNKIGTNIIIRGITSIDNLVAKKNNGESKLSNYGLLDEEINRQKTNIYSDE